MWILRGRTSGTVSAFRCSALQACFCAVAFTMPHGELIRGVDMPDLKLGAATKAAEKPTIKTCAMPHHRFLQNFLALHCTALHCAALRCTALHVDRSHSTIDAREGYG